MPNSEVLALCCAECNAPIASDEELLPEQIARLESASYAYQLELLGNEEAWVYSATNPETVRFDVARFGGDARRRCRLNRSPTTDHSFFPPFAWSMASCHACGYHLGWAFSNKTEPAHESHVMTNGKPNGEEHSQGASTDENDGGCAFIGLILTHLRERRCTRTELAAAARASAEQSAGSPRQLGVALSSLMHDLVMMMSMRRGGGTGI